MKELLDEYFKRDLTEAEEQKLANWLASSPEESLRFAEKMGGFYKDLGLAEPSWSGGHLPAKKSLGLGKWILALALGAAAFLVYGKVHKMGTAVAPVVEQPQPAQTQGIPVMVKNKRRSQPPPEVSKPMPIPENHSSSLSPQQASQDPGLPALEPAIPVAPRAGTQEGESERLTVKVNQPRAGLVTVKVVDGKGDQVRALYAGILPAGSRSFTWDGKTDQGSLAKPGSYFLEFKSGTNVHRQELNLGATE